MLLSTLINRNRVKNNKSTTLFIATVRYYTYSYGLLYSRKEKQKEIRLFHAWYMIYVPRFFYALSLIIYKDMMEYQYEYILKYTLSNGGNIKKYLTTV